MTLADSNSQLDEMREFVKEKIVENIKKYITVTDEKCLEYI